MTRTDSDGKTSPSRHAAQPHLQWVAGAAAVASIALVVLTVVLRIAYPYELEWMEGGVLDHVERIRAGETIYGEPTLRFVPFIYPPFYYYLSAAAMSVFGDGFLGPRLVSAVASIGCALLIGGWVVRETGKRLPALCAAAFYLATFSITDGWFDLARVDALLPLLVLGAAWWIRFGRGSWTAAAAGLLLCAALFTKQSTIVWAGPLLLWQLVYCRRRFWITAAAWIVPSVLIWAYLHVQSDGWFTYWVFVLPRQHPWEWWSLSGFWLSDLLPHVPVALAAVVLLAFVRRRRWQRRPAALFYVALATGGFGVSWLSRLHTGGGVNTIIPALAVTAVLLGMAMARLPRVIERNRRLARRKRGQAPRDIRSSRGLRWMGSEPVPFFDGLLQATIPIAVAVQLLLLAPHPWNWMPTAADRRAGDALVEQIRQCEGDVLVPTSSYLAVRAGKPATAHHMAVMDLLRATGSEPIKREFLHQANRELAGSGYESILLYRTKGWFDSTPIADAFEYRGPAVASPNAFLPKSGTTDYVPKHYFARKRG